METERGSRAALDDAELRSRLAAIVDSSADAIIGKTLDGIITSWNASAARIYGYPAEEMIGRSVAILFPPDRAGELASILDRIRLGGRVEHHETKRVRKDGATIHVSVSVSPIMDTRGQITGAATVARDITERMGYEARLRQAERMETLGQLAGGIAHDFNNMLGAIMGYATLAADEAADRPGLRADIEEILRTAERAAALTRDLLIFSRRESARPEAVSLNRVIDRARGLLTASLGGHIMLRTELTAGLPSVWADPGRLEQVLLNLAVNARDAMPDGGTFTIATMQARLDEETARLLGPQARPGPAVQVAISDTGTGMSPEVMRHIFEPFFTTKEPAHGTGLGLATVYGTITAVGGAITVDSEEGAGTTFRICLPAIGSPATVPAVPAQAASSSAWPRGRGETILVVDDEPAVLEATSRILRQHGYATLEASTGDEALALISTRDLSLVLTDSAMPHMTGRTLADRARRLRPGLRVLQMSGRLPEAGADQGMTYLQKPFTAQALLGEVRTMLDARTSGREGEHQGAGD